MYRKYTTHKTHQQQEGGHWVGQDSYAAATTDSPGNLRVVTPLKKEVASRVKKVAPYRIDQVWIPDLELKTRTRNLVKSHSIPSLVESGIGT